MDDAGEIIDGEAHVCWRNGETLLIIDICVIGTEQIPFIVLLMLDKYFLS